MAKTTYVVLRKYAEPNTTAPTSPGQAAVAPMGRPITTEDTDVEAPHGELWEVLGEAEGASDIAAIKKVASEEANQTYIAIPKRSMRERKGGVEQKTLFKLS